MEDWFDFMDKLFKWRRQGKKQTSNQFWMLSRKLLLSLGGNPCFRQHIPSIPTRSKKRKHFGGDHTPSTPFHKETTLFDDNSSYSSVQSCEDVSSEENEEEHTAEQAMCTEYKEATHTQTDTQIHQLTQTLNSLKLSQFPDTFLGTIRRREQQVRIESLETTLSKLYQIQNHSTSVEYSALDEEECLHCGMTGTLHINVHRCTRHCSKCHRESTIEYFHETTGANLITTNPGQYVRRDHFISTLRKIQAQRPVKLPPTLLGEVKMYMVREHDVHKPKDIQYRWMKPALKALDYNNKKTKGDYMDHIMSIYCQLTGRNPPRFTIQQTQTLIQDFDALNAVFPQACCLLEIKRINWLNYEFTIFKLCEKNHYDSMQRWFGILKGPDTLKKQDMIISKMFTLNGWDPIPTKIPGGEDEEDHTKVTSLPLSNYSVKRAKPSHVFMDLHSFVQSNKDILQGSSSTSALVNLDDHIMSTDEEDEEDNGPL